MSPIARWIVSVAGLLFAVTAFLPLTVSAHIWTALLLGAVVGVIGFEAARRTASWPGALISLVALWMLASSFVGGVQTGAGHLWTNLLTGATLVAITVFVHDTEVRPV